MAKGRIKHSDSYNIYNVHIQLRESQAICYRVMSMTENQLVLLKLNIQFSFFILERAKERAHNHVIRHTAETSRPLCPHYYHQHRLWDKREAGD